MGFYTTNGGLIGPGAQFTLSGVYNLEQARFGSRLAPTFYTSRGSQVTEGAISNYLTINSGSTWNYGGSNSDCAVITTTGVSATLKGFSIGNYASGASNSMNVTMRVISGSTTGGTILKSQSFTAVPLNTGIGQTMVRFTDGILLAPGTYTLAFSWTSAQTFTSYQYNSGFRSSSSIAVPSGTLGITYGSVTSFNGSSPLNVSNGTNGTAQGQIVTLEWTF
jgi:hypothetical protein